MEKGFQLNPQIAVIIPAYNAEVTIVPCIQSLQCQTYNAHEIIVVDDGSKDNTLSILTELAHTDKTIKVIHQENQGVSTARNTALQSVSENTTHVCFVDADDTVEADFLHHFAVNIEENKLLAQGFIKQYKNRTEIVLYHETEPLLQQMVEKGDLGHIFDKCFDMHIIRQYHLRFVKQFTFAEDEAFVLDYMQHVPNIKFINVAQYNYVVPISKKSYTMDNNMGTYFYCLSRMANICKALNLPLHIIYRSRLYRCDKQFFKPSNFKQNSATEIKHYFHNYILSTRSVPLFFSIWHLFSVLIYTFHLKNLYIKLLINTFGKNNCSIDE